MGDQVVQKIGLSGEGGKEERHVPRAMASENATATGTLDIVCGTLQAKLLTGDLSSGSSLCILLDSKTITPCQFQREAGKAAAKNWKTTIRYKDKPLKHFLETTWTHLENVAVVSLFLMTPPLLR